MQFMTELHTAGYRIGVAQHIAVQDLLLTLITKGDLRELHQLKPLIGPIVCSSPIEQEDFQQRFDQWAELVDQQRYSPLPTAEQKASKLSSELSKLEKRASRWRQWLIISTTTILIGVFFPVPVGHLDEASIADINNQQSQPDNEPVPTSPSEPDEVFPTPELIPPVLEEANPLGFEIGWRAYLLLPSLMLIVWRIWWQRRARLFLNRLGGAKPPELQKVSMQGSEATLFLPSMVSDAARLMRDRTRSLTNTLDINKTIYSFLENGSWLTPIYGYRKLVPEYLFLIDRRSYQDHQVELSMELIQQLQQRDVYITSYFFDGDAQICYPNDLSSVPRSLQSIMNQHRRDRLVVIAAARSLYRSYDGRVALWVEQLQSFEKRAILVPKELWNWDATEIALARQWPVFPLTSEGIRALSQFFRNGDSRYREGSSPRVPIPTELTTRPQRWLARNSPPEVDVQQILVDLKSCLGTDGFYWLSACAIFPKLHWNITLYLGTALKTSVVQPLLKSGSLVSLSHLPWFRYGYIPDWLRERLIADLTASQKRRIRGELQELLVTAVQGDTNNLQLAVATQHRKFLPQLADSLLYLSSRQSTEESPLRDYIFLSFMAKKSKLAVEATDNFNHLFDQNKNRSELGILRNAVSSFLSFSAYNAFEFFMVSAIAVAVWGVGMILIPHNSREFQPLFSQLDTSLILGAATEAKQRGFDALTAGDYDVAVVSLRESLDENRNDPESLIYLNNALIGADQAHTIAVVMPASQSINATMEVWRGVAQVQSEINQSGGIDGTPMRVLLFNDDGNSETAAEIATQLVDNRNILGVIGHFSSDATLSAAPVYERGQLTTISPTSTAIAIADAGDYIFRTVPSDRLEAATLARYTINQLGDNPRAAIFYSGDSAYSESSRSEFSTELLSNGGQVAATFDMTAPGFDVESAIQSAQNTGANVVMLAPNTSTLDRAYQVIEVNQQRMPVIGTSTLYNPNTLRLDTNAVGLIVAIPWIIQNHESSSFVRESRRLWGGNVSWRTASAYDAATALATAIDEDATRTGVARVLGSSDFSAEGATDMIRFLPSGDRNQPLQLVRVVRGDRSGLRYDFVPIK